MNNNTNKFKNKNFKKLSNVDKKQVCILLEKQLNNQPFTQNDLNDISADVSIYMINKLESHIENFLLKNKDD